ncbi:MBL fold metallo-hydrolase [Chloroflexi bacterium TSY]|nr:MBL fold metallo-hydrolase [Chloroflexi bacterium TSY]
MRVKWYAHASLRLEGDGVSIITDPYTPHKSGFATITEPADLVFRSSDDDSAHANAEMITGDPEIVTATHIGPEGVTAKGIHVIGVPTKESMIHKLEPKDNAMYCFTLEGIRIVHFGDVGNPLADWQLEKVADADIVITPTGGPPTIELDDLQHALDQIQPKLTIPMHYSLPGCKFPKMLDVTDFTRRYQDDSVIWVEEDVVEISISRSKFGVFGYFQSRLQGFWSHLFRFRLQKTTYFISENRPNLTQKLDIDRQICIYVNCLARILSQNLKFGSTESRDIAF